ncbi:peptide-methionine (R)-S-oxide reductase MsrB [Patescibacteria group bacterium]|nr:peptide-methionine (R)-S-oxide reductase MsrB [Candidatus Paceibacterota bacterium]MBP9710575.1 peptide-methionine (R)-S-oxide reductase MsrB [Patescibacteria group bacterium]
MREHILVPPTPTTTSSTASSSSMLFGSPSTTEIEWKNLLPPKTYHIMREAGTERPFSNPLNSEKRAGTYVSADCGEPLFRSEQKYHSGTGWPSFWAPINSEAVKLDEDTSIPFQPRTEVITSKCGGHLGHVFDDGPEPTGKRYCINGAALRFIPDPVASSTSSTIGL